MKLFKKIMALAIAMVMVLSMSISVFAANHDISTTSTTHTYEIYQIFTGTVVDGQLTSLKYGKNTKDRTVDAAVEKHVPDYRVEGNMVTVTVGSVEHPMLPEHYIEWVFLQTKHGNQKKVLCPGDKPVVYFSICDGDEVEAVYAYCNLHSLWKA